MAINYNKKLSDTSCRVGEVRFSYVQVLSPKADLNGKDKYSVCLLITKDNEAAVKLITGCINAAKELGKAAKWGGKVPGNCKGLELRDGDVEKEDDPNYAGCWFINASANPSHKPFARVRDDDGSTYDALDEDEIYSGSYGAAVINFFPYDSNGAKGVACGLSGIVKTRDGDKLSGGISADAALADL